MDEIRTWQQAMDYTFKTRHSWRHGNGRKTSLINCQHFTRLRGGSFLVSKITQPILNHVCIELEDEVLQLRKEKWNQPSLKVKKGSLYKYARMVSSASQGCVTDKF